MVGIPAVRAAMAGRARGRRVVDNVNKDDEVRDLAQRKGNGLVDELVLTSSMVQLKKPLVVSSVCR